MLQGMLMCERGAGSGKRGFVILIFLKSYYRGQEDLLLWVMKL
jgi:hypothetical protein